MSPLDAPAPAAAPAPGKTASPAPAPAPAAGPTTPGASTPVTVVPGDCDDDGILDFVDGDDDNDNLSDALEAAIKTNPCAEDSDGDVMEDAFEYHSALDLNSAALPYPGKRPYPNALDGSDGFRDYDGDGMTSFEEHAMWQRYGARALPLNYSDGTQFTGPPVPAPTAPSLAHLNIVTGTDSSRDNAELSDDERDADGDRLGNWDEAHGRLHPGFWKVQDGAEKQFPNHFSQPDYLDPDSDGDGVLDGDDDQDFDDVDNVSELTRGPFMVHAYNPCLPDWTSRTCPRYVPGGVEPWAPFDRDPLPPPPVPWP